MKICIISVSTTALNALESIRKRHAWIRDAIELVCRYAGNDSLNGPALAESLDAALRADLLILDLMGVDDQVQNEIGAKLVAFNGQVIVTNSDKATVRGLSRLGKFTLSAMQKGRDNKEPWQEKMAKARKMMTMAENVSASMPVGMLRDMRNYFWITKYWRYADEYNMFNLLCLLGREYGHVKNTPPYKPPREAEDAVIHDPRCDESFKRYTAWEKSHPPDTSKPLVVLLYNSGRYPVDTHPAIGMLLEKMERTCRVIPVSINRITTDNIKRVRNLFPAGIDCIVNLLAFRLGQGPMGGNAEDAVALLHELNVPVLHPFFITRRLIDQWREDPHGTQSSEFLISIFLPELDGCIESIPLGAINSASDTWGRLELLADRVERIIERIEKWRALRAKANSEKRLAIILYNYPPGEGGIGAGAFLDVLSSVEAMAHALHDRGYSVASLTAEIIRQRFENSGNCNNPQWQNAVDGISVSADEYHSMTTNAAWAEKIRNNWGDFPGTVMANRDSVRIPGFIDGNVFIGLQPVRTHGAVSARDYHDPHKPPHHQYAAFYLWLQHCFKADAVIHVGTHGTLEFLPGKETALSGNCFPDAFIGPMPHLYCYYSGNPSESSIAKRRSHAVMISHLQPPFITGGLYGSLQEIEGLLDEYSMAANLDQTRLAAIKSDIINKVKSLGWTCETLPDIAARLDDVRRSLVPGRLHRFGTPFSHGEAVDFLWQFYRCRHDEEQGIADKVARQHAWNWGVLQANPLRFAHEIEVVERECRMLFEKNILHPEPPADTAEEKAWRLFYALVKSTELDNLCKALEGGYIAAGLGGDAFRNPEVLPSGRNLFQYDPRSVPSPSATRAGIQMAENVCAMYKQEHGVFPRSVAVVLWGLETSKTNGETVAQILHFLGVRVLRPNPWETKLEVIPISELGRPRVDVTIQMSGFLRDLFPNVIELVQNALELVGALKESDEQNPIIPHARVLMQSLQQEGYLRDEAYELSLARMFGPDAAVYGTALTGLVKSREWESESELVDAYTHSLRFVYTKRFFGREMKDLLKCNLARAQIVSQVRSSMDYEITDLDHYYEFLGGLSRTVAAESGKKAMVLVSDSVEGRPRSETARYSIQRGIRSRLLNPRWQDGMLAHNYHGAQEFASRLEILVGLAATTGEVDNALFEDTACNLVLDNSMRKRLADNNPHALREIIERLLEANARGYWETALKTIDEIKQLYLALEGDIEARQESTAETIPINGELV